MRIAVISKFHSSPWKRVSIPSKAKYSRHMSIKSTLHTSIYRMSPSCALSYSPTTTINQHHIQHWIYKYLHLKQCHRIVQHLYAYGQFLSAATHRCRWTIHTGRCAQRMCHSAAGATDPIASCTLIWRTHFAIWKLKQQRISNGRSWFWFTNMTPLYYQFMSPICWMFSVPKFESFNRLWRKKNEFRKEKWRKIPKENTNSKWKWRNRRILQSKNDDVRFDFCRCCFFFFCGSQFWNSGLRRWFWFGHHLQLMKRRRWIKNKTKIRSINR